MVAMRECALLMIVAVLGIKEAFRVFLKKNLELHILSS